MNTVKTCPKEYRPDELVERQVEINDQLKVDSFKLNHIWHVKADLIDDTDFDNLFQYGTYTGFVVSAPCHDTVWALMQSKTELADVDYDNYKWSMRVVGLDLTGEGNRVIESSYKAG